MKQKRRFVLIGIFALLLFFSACNMNNMNGKTINNNAKTEVLPELDSIHVSLGEDQNQIMACHRFFVAESYSEYSKAMETKYLPDNFVSYDSIKSIGEFKDFMSYIYDQDSEDDSIGEFYWYTLIDSNGNSIPFRVKHTRDNTFVISDTIWPGSQRRGELSENDLLSPDATGYIVRDNLVYIY